MTHTTIVVGVDGAWHRTGAVDWALDQALRSGAQLHLAHVVDSRFNQFAPLVIETVGARAQALIKAVGDSARERNDSVYVTAEALSGSPGTILADIARSAQLLVVGRRGVGGFGRLLIGSTSEGAVNHTDVPVVVVPDGWRPETHAFAPVVLGVDAADPSVAATEFAFATAAERGVALRLVSYWDLPNGYVWDASYVTEELRSVEGESRRMFDEFVETWTAKHPDVEVTTAFRRGHPAQGLVTDAIDADAQLIVVGGRRHNRLSSFVLGSVARGVLHHADRPLAVVHDARAGS